MGNAHGSEEVRTRHRIALGDARHLDNVAPGSVDLVVTSPPYPMIEMWDRCFAKLDPAIAEALGRSDGQGAFEKMHSILDQAWTECVDALREGGFLCVSIGDATRTLGRDFRLYTNHARVAQACTTLKLSALPIVLWEKQTNSPNKFMGSGMLPAGAYVTLEHEYILIFRKGGRREFSNRGQAERRRRSAFFWEERNQWFSDVWDFKGERQQIAGAEVDRRSAAFPLELPYRLIAMLSVEGDTVLDPFIGTGTTALAAIALGRNSLGYDSDEQTVTHAWRRLLSSWREVAARNLVRLDRHDQFVATCSANGKDLRHTNATYGFPVMTQHEVDLRISTPIEVLEVGRGEFEATHRPLVRSPRFARELGLPPIAQPTLSAWQ